MHTMPKLIAILSLLLVCSGCSNQTQQMTTIEKSKLVSEQILDNKQCNHFKNDLHSTSVSNVEIDKIYDDATKAHCINKDI
jgi:L-fucose mutarotase/ribose pyranase (RbsD/FucU family)